MPFVGIGYAVPNSQSSERDGNCEQVSFQPYHNTAFAGNNSPHK